MTWKQFETEVAQSPEKIFADFIYWAANISCRLNVFVGVLSGSKRKIGNCIVMLSNLLGSARKASSVKPSASALSTSTAAAGMALSTSAGPGSDGGPQQFRKFLLDLG